MPGRLTNLSFSLHRFPSNPFPPQKYPNQPNKITYLPLKRLFFPLLSLFFSRALSLFPNGNPLVLLSAPVVLLTRAASPPNNNVQVPKQNNAALPISPAVKAKLHPPPITCV
jgi:hypothetical protein